MSVRLLRVHVVGERALVASTIARGEVVIHRRTRRVDVSRVVDTMSELLENADVVRVTCDSVNERGALVRRRTLACAPDDVARVIDECRQTAVTSGR